MLPTRQGSIRLFRFSGIEVFLHWSWFLVAAYEVTQRSRGYSSLTWNTLEYLALFCIVLLHEFGHALACRQVGGRADQIVLWPLGGVAYVSPPQRPGATLWSIAAGPLVNVVLLLPLTLLLSLARSSGWAATSPDGYALLHTVWLINLILLLFNLLPVYPLDGGQILRSLLWFWLGRARSLMVATFIGLAGGGALVLLALLLRSFWFGILAAFMIMNCWKGLQHALALNRVAQAPRHANLACPGCGHPPPTAALWICGACQYRFDIFAADTTCPQCGARFPAASCPDCGAVHPIEDWHRPPPLPADREG